MANLKSSLAQAHRDEQKNRPVKYGGKIAKPEPKKDVKK